jgi:hypothetical protein
VLLARIKAVMRRRAPRLTDDFVEIVDFRLGKWTPTATTREGSPAAGYRSAQEHLLALLAADK